MLKDYEMVIGLEVHVELKTKSKIFCSCPTDFGADPNTQCCPVCMGMPGTLPVLNGEVVRFAIKAGLATNCQIEPYSKQDRKNYFYPDLPKAYQISQYDLPLCHHGHLLIETPEGQKKIGITRIHIEEDAGKLIHDDKRGTLVDCNRCGVPLIEIVSEPDIRSAKEAAAYLQKLKAIISYTGISDCKMNEGSLRCDVNLSVRKIGDTILGTRTEMKNLNSFQSVTKAIEQEYIRQVEAVEKGEKIVQETRRFDQLTGQTYSMRRKENANDYRYFPDPDLMPIETPLNRIEDIKAEIPTLPDARKAVYMRDFGLSAFAAEQLTGQKEIADYFEKAAALTRTPVTLCNLLITEIFRLLPLESVDIPISPMHLAKLADLLSEGQVNSSAGKKVLSLLWEKDRNPEDIVCEYGLYQLSDDDELLSAVKEAIAQNPKMLEGYKKGKTNMSKALMGQAMALTQGKANPVKLQELLQSELDKP
jgi:aspartyl-tRNA(Asn)/glutamyl-tRNA(Gln) amidotransferase subunit B